MALLRLDDGALHVGVRAAVDLQLAQHATRLVGDADEHGEDLAHHERHRARPNAARQLRDTTLAEERPRETPVVDVDLRTDAVVWRTEPPTDNWMTS